MEVIWQITLLNKFYSFLEVLSFEIESQSCAALSLKQCQNLLSKPNIIKCFILYSDWKSSKNNWKIASNFMCMSCHD